MNGNCKENSAPVEASMPDGRNIVAATMQIDYKADLTMDDGERVQVSGHVNADRSGVAAITKMGDEDYQALTSENEVRAMLDTLINLVRKAKNRPVLGAGCCPCSSPVAAK